MTIEKIMMLIVGSMILATLALAHFVSPMWLWFTAFIGANLIISGVTGFCPMVYILRKLGLNHGCAFRGCAQ